VIYLDANATTPPIPEAIAAVQAGLQENWANPSSIHRAGQAARHLVELARADVAALIGCSERELVFTSGGTEAADLAIRGTMQASGRRVLATSRLEHAAVRDLATRLAERGEAEVVWLEHDPHGRVLPQSLDQLLRARGPEVGLVSVMAANNETGILQPVRELAAIARAAGVAFHTDATQAVGRMPVSMTGLGVDLLTCAAHKLHGPKGIGALAIRRGVHVQATLCGGPQERERRAGTENVAGIAGFGAAARAARAWLEGPGIAEGARLRDLLESLLLQCEPNAQVHGADVPRLWNTTNIAFPRLEAEAILLALSERGVAASAGAACSSGSLEPSPVLLAMGIPPELAHGSVRFSLSRCTTEAEIRDAVTRIASAVAAVRATSTSAIRD
jgi:cysteine desulfurase